MKRILLACFIICSLTAGAQSTYYWVGGLANGTINTAANWNTAIDGTGATRASSSNGSDILIFNGANLGGITPTTGAAIVSANAGITAAQLKFINGANISFTRPTTGTTTINLNGEAGEDFVIEAGASLSITSNTGSIVIAMVAANTGRVSGTLSMITSQQTRIANTSAGSPASLIFTNGSSFITNITGTSTYGFGNNTQSSEKWVQFQSGSNLYYDGGNSPMGSNPTFMPIDFLPGSTWHHRVTINGAGSFFNNKSFANIIVENGATLAADGPINRIDNLTVTSGSSFVSFSSGSTAISGNIVVDGSLSAQAVTRDNTIVLNGVAPQTISGSGTISIPELIVADNADVSLAKSITALDTSVVVYGRLNFGTSQLRGTGTFSARANTAIAGLAGTVTSGSNQITAVAGTLSGLTGLTVTGTGILANTTVAGFSLAGTSITLSKPAVASGTGVVLNFSSDSATLVTSNLNGFDAATGSVAVTDNKIYQAGISYTINAATAQPFGISTGSTATSVVAGVVNINAPVITNTGFTVLGSLTLNSSKLTVRAQDTVKIVSGAALQGSFSSANYIATAVNASNNTCGVLQIDGINANQIFPIGSLSNYLPATISATGSDFAASVYEGITNNGLPNGSPLTGVSLQTKVNAVWKINRINGSGVATLGLQWTPAVEGSTFATLADSEIGIIVNQNPGWALPIGAGNNATNTASAGFSAFGLFGVGAQPPAQAFLFNALPVKTYGDANFDGGAISANTIQPIIYSSSNPAVAIIVNNQIRITGAGNTNITASQATDGFYPAASETRILTVNKAPLTITADNKSKPQGDANPVLTLSYAGFVYNETAAVLLTPGVASTTATTASGPGVYPITVTGATASNYNITFVNGTLSVTPRQNQTITFNAPAVKTYGNADFAAGATSTNTTIPITYTSSNTTVATIVGSNIHIVGAGTATITASQAGNDFFFPATSVARTLTVNKANLSVRVLDTVKVYGQPNPVFTLVYTGFVLGETATALPTPPIATTTATATSQPGYYTINVDGGVSNNYNFTYTAGRLTILPSTGTTVGNLQAYMSSNSNLLIKVYSPTPDIADVIVYDISGKPVARKNAFLPQGFITVNLLMINQAAGAYIVTVNGRVIKLKTIIALTR